jgi:D-3-phosphoglycerate dehydrogenase
MKPTAVLVNTARGGLIDADALAAALHAGRLGGAGIDVFEPEPLPAESPLRGAPRLILTPHMSWYSDTAIVSLQRLAAEEIARALLGQPLRCPVRLS